LKLSLFWRAELILTFYYTFKLHRLQC
jgi:hypothetical protein